MRIFTDLYFVRHGETDGNNAGLLQGRGNSHLSPNGFLQAHAAAEELKDVPFSFACTSDLVRAVETAETILGKHPGIALEKTDSLEEWNLGIYEGRKQSEILVSEPEIMNKFRFEHGDFDVRGGESRSEFQKRVSSYLEDILERARGGTILLVAHGWVAPRILAHFYGIPKTGAALPVPANTGISIFRYFNDEKTSQLLTWNSTSHLKNLPSHRNPVD